MRVDQLAINLVSTRQASLEEALDAYAAAGFRQVELTFRDARAWLGGRPNAELLRALEARSLTAVGGFESAVECFSAPESRRANRALHLANARLLHDLGGGVLTVGTDGPPSPRRYRPPSTRSPGAWTNLPVPSRAWTYGSRSSSTGHR